MDFGIILIGLNDAAFRITKVAVEPVVVNISENLTIPFTSEPTNTWTLPSFSWKNSNEL